MNRYARIAIVVVLVAVVGAILASKQRKNQAGSAATQEASPGNASQVNSTVPAEGSTSEGDEKAKLPRLVDLGAGKCIPCKMMAPILEELKKAYKGRMEVQFIDVWENPRAGDLYGLRMIPTQIFYDASGKELFRHEGFFSREDILGKWKELGINLEQKPAASIAREVPVVADNRPRDKVCFMCDGDVNPKSRVIVKGQTEQVLLCSPHCFFIYHSSLHEPGKAEPITSVTDAATGNLIRAATAVYLHGLDQNGRPTIIAYGDKESAAKDQQKSGGDVMGWDALCEKELATRCGFCDRAVYPEDACTVKVAETTRTYGCCVMCGLGVAARLQKDIELEAKDSLTGERVRVQTLNGSVASLEPNTAVAWAGGKKSPDGNWASTGCFKQAFFSAPSMFGNSGVQVPRPT